MILRRIRLFRLVTVKNLFLIRAGNEPSQARLGSVWLAHSATRAWLGSASERAHKIGLVRFVIGSRATATCMTVAAMDGRRAVGGGRRLWTGRVEAGVGGGYGRVAARFQPLE